MDILTAFAFLEGMGRESEATAARLIREGRAVEAEMYKNRNEALLVAANLISAEQERQNPKPLTLEEVLKHCGEPVWVRSLTEPKASRWAIVEGGSELDGVKYLYLQGEYEYETYEKTAVAYRHKPKEENK